VKYKGRENKMTSQIFRSLLHSYWKGEYRSTTHEKGQGMRCGIAPCMYFYIINNSNAPFLPCDPSRI